MRFQLVRVLRTPHSERFMLQGQAGDMAALDLHYLPSGRVDGTLVVFEQAGLEEKDIPKLLERIDEDILPDVSVQDGNLSFTVVIGRVVGAFLPVDSGASPVQSA